MSFKGGATIEEAQRVRAARPVRRPGEWFADPYGEADLRWWDGGEWTHHVRGHEDADRSAAPEAVRSVPPPLRATDPGLSAVQRLVFPHIGLSGG